jgi:predicted nuclease of predicted toxin-antitoxin system
MRVVERELPVRSSPGSGTGHDVLSVKESMTGAADAVVLARAQAEGRIVLTCDTDFGELAFRSGLPSECGVILIRMDWNEPQADNRAILTALTSRDDWSGVFAVLEKDRLRIRQLPPGGA